MSIGGVGHRSDGTGGGTVSTAASSDEVLIAPGRPMSSIRSPCERLIHHVGRAPGAAESLAAGAEAEEGRRLLADDILQVDLRLLAGLIADDEGRAGDVFHPAVAHPKQLGVAFVDRDGRRDGLELVADQRQPGLLGLDGRYALPLEGRIQEGELPTRRGPLGDDAVLAAEEVEVLGLVAGLADAGVATADLEVHVGQVAVLGIVGADAHGRGVAVEDADVDVAHRAVERPRAGVAETGAHAPVAARNAPRPPRPPPLVGPPPLNQIMNFGGPLWNPGVLAPSTIAGRFWP